MCPSCARWMKRFPLDLLHLLHLEFPPNIFFTSSVSLMLFDAFSLIYIVLISSSFSLTACNTSNSSSTRNARFCTSFNSSLQIGSIHLETFPFFRSFCNTCLYFKGFFNVTLIDSSMALSSIASSSAPQFMFRSSDYLSNIKNMEFLHNGHKASQAQHRNFLNTKKKCL